MVPKFTKNIVIAEKPSVAVSIIKAMRADNFIKKDGYYEGDNLIITWQFGHLLQLISLDEYKGREKTTFILEELPFVPNDRAFKFKVKQSMTDKGMKEDPGARKQYEIIKSLIKRSDVKNIVHAGDKDREGEILVNIVVNTIFKELNLTKPVLRLDFKEQTENTLRKAMNNLKSDKEYANLNNEGMARLYRDFLEGINYSRYATILSRTGQGGTTLNVGSVIVPIVKHIYDRRIERDNFIPEIYFTVAVEFDKDEETLKNFIKDIKFSRDERNDAIAFIKTLNGKRAVVTDIQVKDIKKEAPKLFSLSSLQDKMFKDFKMSSMDTLTYTQKLYEKGWVTYPRTNTEYIDENEKGVIKALVEKFSEKYDIEFKDTKKIFDSSKIDSHSAITPTTKDIDINIASDNEKKVYDVILNRFLANFCKERSIVEETKVLISIADKYIVMIKGLAVIQKGYLKFENNVSDKTIPIFKLGESFICNYSLEEGKTKIPPFIDESSLSRFLLNPFRKEKASNTEEEQDNNIVQEMNDTEDYKAIISGLEIGTVATRAAVIQKAVKVEYITNKKGNFDITEKGMYLIKTLDTLGIDLYKEKAVKISKMLKEVYRNNLTVDGFIDIIEQDLKNTIIIDGSRKIEGYTTLKEIIGACPRCGKNIYESSKAYYCEGFRSEPQCKFSLFKEDKFFKDKGKSLNKSMAKSFIKNGKATVKGLKKKDGSGTYNALVVLADTGKYINYKIEGFVN